MDDEKLPNEKTKEPDAPSATSNQAEGSTSIYESQEEEKNRDQQKASDQSENNQEESTKRKSRSKDIFDDAKDKLRNWEKENGGDDEQNPVINLIFGGSGNTSIHTGSGDNKRSEERSLFHNKREDNLSEGAVLIAQAELEEVYSTFVYSNFTVEHPSLSQQKLLTLSGPEQSGKYAAALTWGAYQKQLDKIDQVISITDSADGNLESIIKRHSQQQRCLFVIRDACAKKGSLLLRALKWHETNAVDFFKQILKSSYLIITISENHLGNLSNDTVEHFSEKRVLLKDYKIPDPTSVLNKHMCERLGVTFSSKLIERLGPYLEETAQALIYPRKIAKLVENVLQAIDLESDDDDIKAFISEEVSYINDLQREIAQFIDSLSEEEKLTAFNLSLLNQWPASDFWHTNQLIIPEAPDDKKLEQIRKSRKYLHLSDQPKFEIIRRIRAKSTLSEEGIGHIEFNDSDYGKAIQVYFKENYPEYLIGMIKHLGIIANENTDDFYIRFVVSQIIGLISRASWPTVKKLIDEWSVDDKAIVRSMAGRILSSAYKDDETKVIVKMIFDEWSKGLNHKLAWTVANAVKDLRHINLDLAFDLIEKMARQMDTSYLTWAWINQTNENQGQSAYIHHILLHENVTLDAGLQEVETAIDNYFQKVKTNKHNWEKQELTFNALCYALVVIAENYCGPVIEILCDWVNETDDSENKSMKLTGGLIWVFLAKEIQEISERKEDPNPFIELIQYDETMLDALSELLSGSLKELYKVKLAQKRLSIEICQMLEGWITDENTGIMAELIMSMRQYLKDDLVVSKYADKLFFQKWQSKRLEPCVNIVSKKLRSEH